MSAYEEIRNRLSKNDKNGFSLWKKVIAGMAAGGSLKIYPPNQVDYLFVRYWSVYGLSNRPDQDSDSDGGQKTTVGQTSQSGGDGGRV